MIRRRRTPYHRALETLLRRALQLLDAFIDVVERHHRDAREPAWTIPAIVRQPIVVGAEARRAQRTILQLEKTHAETRVENLGEDTVAFLVLEAQLGIPCARTHAGIAARHLFGEVLGIDAGDRKARHWKWTQTLGDEKIALALAGALDHARRAIEEGLSI